MKTRGNGRGERRVGVGRKPKRREEKQGHYVVVGRSHDYRSFGGLVAGRLNTIIGAFASVGGGDRNVAAGDFSSVSGGRNRTAAKDFNWAAGSLLEPN